MGMINKRPTIGFWAGDQNNFQFINPLIEHINKKYNIMKFEYFGDDQKVIQEMSNVDLCWFEWGGGPIIPASQSIKTKPIINRIHRFELYLNEPKLIKWQNVDYTILSSPSMMKKFKIKFPQEYEIASPKLIEIGVDTKLFKFKEKNTTKNILYVGRIHPHKNPSLLLQIMSKLVSIDKDYILNVIGNFHDELYEEYFFDQLEKLNLKNNVVFHGYMNHKEMVKIMQNSDYFIITSIIEGLSQASLEAMSCGVVPIISNYYGAEAVYPNKYIYNTIDEAVDKILNPVATRQEARDIIDENYLLKDKINEVESIFKRLIEK